MASDVTNDLGRGEDAPVRPRRWTWAWQDVMSISVLLVAIGIGYYDFAFGFAISYLAVCIIAMTG